TAEVSRADYWIFSDALYHPKLAQSWSRHLAPWFDTTGLDAHSRSLLTAARFCADGAWMSEATGVFPSDDLAAVRDHALGLIGAAEQEVAESTRPDCCCSSAPSSPRCPPPCCCAPPSSTRPGSPGSSSSMPWRSSPPPSPSGSVCRSVPC